MAARIEVRQLSMWTSAQFWKSATWRAFRTFCQSLAGLLTVEHVSTNLHASWWALIYASGVAGLISLLQSVDRERAVGEVTAEASAEPEVSAANSDPASANYRP